MKWVPIPIKRENLAFFMCPWTGTLLVERDQDVEKHIEIPSKLKQILTACDYPYSLQPNSNFQEKWDIQHKDRNCQKYANTLLKLCRINLFMARLYSSFASISFPNSRTAISYYRDNMNNLDQAKACLPRSLFALKTSKEFRTSGALIIGIFLPSRAMHAWIIENNMNADPLDKIWTSYQPVAAIYHP